MFTMCNAALNACWDSAIARRHWTEQWLRDQVAGRPLPNRTEFINFSKRDLINDDSSFCSLILSAIDLQCHVFSFWKAFIKLSVFDCKRHFWWRQTWRHLHVTMLKCWAIFSNILIHWSIRMIPAKNYKTVFKFVKVMPRKLVASFFWTRCMQIFAGVPSASGRRHQVPYNKWCLSTWKHTSLCAAIVTAICYGQNQYPINALNPMSLNSFRIESAQSIVAVSVNKIKVK